MTDDGRHLGSLAGLRALAALAVFASHASILYPHAAFTVGGLIGFIEEVLRWGAFGVSLFFVLSGFVLAWAWSPTLPTPIYFRRRFVRVWPVHAVMWSAFIVAAFAGVVIPRPSAPGAALSLFLVQAWVPTAGLANAVNPVAWTLSCEWFFYLTFPLIIARVYRCSPRQLAVLGAGVWFAYFSVMTFVLEPRGIIASTFPPLREAEFLLGMIAGSAFRRGLVVRTPRRSSIVAALVVILPCTSWGRGLRGVAVSVLPLVFLAVICSVAFDDIAGRAGLLARASLQRAGEGSYAFYMVHLLPALMIADLMPIATWPGTALAVGIWSAATLALSAALHLLVEKRVVIAARRLEPNRLSG